MAWEEEWEEGKTRLYRDSTREISVKMDKFSIWISVVVT